MEKQPLQQQPTQQPKTCPFCQQQAPMQKHISSCPGLSPDHVHYKPTFLRIDHQGCLCRYCWKLFSEKDWIFHRKSQACRQPSTTSRAAENSQRGRSLPERAPPSSMRPSTTIFGSQANAVPQAISDQNDISLGSSGLTTDMLRIAQAILAPLIKEWVARHQHVRSNVLVVYLTSEVMSFGSNFLQKEIVVPTWSVIEKKGGQTVNWQAFLELPENLFNDVFVDQKLEKMTSARKQLRIVRGLNRLATAFPGLIKKREPPTVNRQPRDKSSVKLGDIIMLIKRLLACRKKRTVHLALDLYIILLCSQRYLADREEIKRGVLGLLESNRNRSPDDLILTFPMQIGKTRYKQEVVLNSQLVLMLKEFGWQGWHSKTERLVKRMREWVGIYGYSFKSAIMEAVTEFGSNLAFAQRLAGHRSIRNTEIYTPGTKFRDILRIIKSLVVPGVDLRFGDYDEAAIMQSLEELRVQHMRYDEFKPDWFPALMRRLYGANYRAHLANDQEINFVAPSVPSQAQATLQPLPMAQQAVSMQEKGEPSVLGDIDEILQEIQRKTVVIYGAEVEFTQQRFHQDDFFVKVMGYHGVVCAACSQPIGPGLTRLQCIYCEGNFHAGCVRTICQCTNNILRPDIPLLPEGVLAANSSDPVLIPGQYMRAGPTDAEQKIKILLAIRRFRYTRVAVVSPGYPISYPLNYWQGVMRLKLSSYQEYVSGRYFPPVQARPASSIEANNVWGVEFGIYATAEIQPHVLIAEYACDILQGHNLILCKKPDSIFRHSGGSSPQDTYLAPKDFSGLATLMNTSSQKNCNCVAVRAIVDGCLRVLLVSSRAIKKEEQLYYSYGSTYKFKTRTIR